ncbi:MAG: restriction endonuclease subunit S [bacterium]
MSKPGDILYCVRGSSTGRMNFSDREYCIGRGLASIRQKANSNTKYIYYILTQVTKRIFAEAKGAGSTFPNISRKGLEETSILIPPIDEQHKIASILSEIDIKIENEQSYKSELEQLKKGLLQVLLTGKVRVKV